MSRWAIVLAGGIFCLALTVFADVTATSTDIDNDTMIPDNGASSDGVVSIISILDVEIIQDVSFTIHDLKHSSLGDLVAQVRYVGTGTGNGGGNNPNSAPLFFRVGVEGTALPGDKSNLLGDYTFTSNFLVDPDTSLWSEAANTAEEDVVDPNINYYASDATGAFFDIKKHWFGGTTSGDWELKLIDQNDFGSEIGSFDGWTINFDSTTAIPEPAGATAIFVGGIAILLRRRRNG